VKELTDTLFKDFEGAALAEYWVTGMEMVEILTQKFISSLKLMLPWMQIYDNDSTAGDTGVAFQISLQCSIPFLLNRLHLWRIVCLRSQWHEIHIRVLPLTYGLNRQWTRDPNWSLIGWRFWTMISNSYPILGMCVMSIGWEEQSISMLIAGGFGKHSIPIAHQVEWEIMNKPYRI